MLGENFSDSALQLAIDTIPGDFGIYKVVDSAFEALYSSPGVPRLVGMNPIEYKSSIANDAADLVIPSDRPYILEHLSEILSDSGNIDSTDFTFRIRHKVDGAIWVRAKARYLGNMDGCPVLAIMFFNVTSETAELSMLLDHSSSMVYVVEKNTYELLYANDVALKGWKRGNKFGGIPCYKFVENFDSPCKWCSISDMANGRFVGKEIQIPGVEIWLDIECYEITWFGRKAIVVFSTNVTEQKKRRLSAEMDRDILQSIVDGIPSGIGIFDIEDNEAELVYLNDGYYLMLDDDPSNRRMYSGANFFDAIHEDDRDIVSDGIEEALHTDGSAYRLFRIIDGNGVYRSISARASHRKLDDRTTRLYVSFFDLGDLLRTQKELEDANVSLSHLTRQYESAIEATKVTVWEYDIQNHRVTVSNSQFAREDFARRELAGVVYNVPDSLVGSLDPESVDTFLEMYSAIEHGAPNASCEVWHKAIHGQERMCEKISYTTIFDDDGKPFKAYGIGQNITARKIEEEHFRLAFQQLADAYPENLGSSHLNLTKNWCGEGRSPLEFVLKQQESDTADGYFSEFSKLIADDDLRQEFLKIFDRMNLLELFSEGQTRMSFEYPIIYEDGVRHWREGILTMAQNPETDDVEGVTYAIDIDNRKKRAAIDSFVSDSGYDFIGMIEYPTLTFEILSGTWDCKEVQRGTRIQYSDALELLIDHVVNEEDKHLVHRNAVWQSVMEKLSKEHSHIFSYRAVGDNGEDLRKQVQFVLLDDLGGSLLVVQTDVTAAYKREQEQRIKLEHALDAAERASASEQAFLANVSHDMRTPLNAIIGFSELANDVDDIGKMREYLRKISSSGKLMVDLVNDVLDMSKIESGKMELHMQSFESRSLFDSLKEAIQIEADKKNITFIANMDAGYPRYISSDRLHLQQIVLNLLTNAIKYTPEGGVVKFNVRWIANESERFNTFVEVSDNGIGMSDEFQKRMFDPFSQEYQSRFSGIQGTGLGLAIVKQIVDLMNGEIEVASHLDMGTTFHVLLPIDIVDTAEPGYTESSGPQIDLRGLNVLLVEDNDLNAEIADMILRERAHLNVTRAVNGREGIDIFSMSEPGEFSAILMDLRMPVMGGIEATKNIRSLDRSDAKRIPIIAMTADAFAEDVQECANAGMNAHVSKPISPERLIYVLNQTIADHIDNVE